MAVELVMPRLGWTMEEGVFIEWLKQDGDTVASGDLLYSVESDKATQEVESFESGVLRIPPNGPAAGATLPVGAVLGYIVQPGEAAPFESEGGDQRSGVGEQGSEDPASSAQNQAPLVQDREEGFDIPATPPRDQGSGVRDQESGNREPVGADHRVRPRTQNQAPPVKDREEGFDIPATATSERQTTTANGRNQRRSGPTISPRARRIAQELGTAWQALAGSGRTGRIIERDVRAALTAKPATPRATPLARRVAEDLGVDLAQVADATTNRRIERADVERAARGNGTPSPAETPRSAPTDARPSGLPLTGMRRIIATRMAESTQTTAAVTLTTDADATELARLRKQIAADLQGSDLRPPSYTDLLAKLVAVALSEHPSLNASLGDAGIVEHEAVHIGIAADTERGLLVPVIRDVHRKSVQQIASESAKLLAQAREGKASADDLRGSTFTITNLGMYEIDAFTPIINLPECAILGVGRIIARPVVIDEDAETIVVRKMMALSLSFDHRIVDGAPAARFLQRVKQFIEHPYSWLTR